MTSYYLVEWLIENGHGWVILLSVIGAIVIFMAYKLSIGKHDKKNKGITGMGKIFESFKIEEKFQELKDLLDSQDLEVFAGKQIVIGVPTVDESGRDIAKEDPELFACQKDDAGVLANLIMEHSQATVVSVITSVREIKEFSDSTGTQSVDYLILLHEFTPFEQHHLTQFIEYMCFTEDKQLPVIELY